LVGRDAELEQLSILLTQVAQKQPSCTIVLISGEPGLGKSRIIGELATYVDTRPDLITWRQGRCMPYGEGITFWALGEMIRSRAGLRETDDEPTTRAAIAAMLEVHVPDEAERSWIAPALLPAGFEGGAAARLFGAWRTFFERLTATRSTVFEDLHHADPVFSTYRSRSRVEPSSPIRS
jgi:predicted ATPase